jgi:hypothetical protein
MKGKQILIALAALVLLSLYLYFFGIKKKADEQKAKEESAIMFPGLKKEDITVITVKGPKVKVTGKRSGNDWEMTDPLRAWADNGMFDNIARALAEEKSERTLTGVLPADYGLNSPDAYVTFSVKDGKTYTINQSGKNPTQSLVYASKPGDNGTVYMVDGVLRNYCDKELKDYRLKGVMVLRDEAVEKIEVAVKDKKYTLEKTGGGWNMTAPAAKPAKPDRITSLIGYMKSSGIKAYEPAGMAAKYGLDSPREYVKIFAEKKWQTVWFGKSDRKKNSIWAKSTEQPDVLELPDYVYNGIPKTGEVENRQPVIFMQDQVSKISIKYGDKSITAEHNAPGKRPEWTYTEWTGLAGKKQESLNITSLISTLFWAEYKDEAGKPSPGEEVVKYGTSPAAAEIALINKDKKTIGTMVFGGAVRGKDEMYLKVSEKNMVYTVSSGLLKNLNLPGWGGGESPGTQNPKPR